MPLADSTFIFISLSPRLGPKISNYFYLSALGFLNIEYYPFLSPPGLEISNLFLSLRALGSQISNITHFSLEIGTVYSVY